MSLHSIVIPVFNEQETLDSTFVKLESLFVDSQSDNFEFILVNDGSRDNTEIILDSFVKRDHRFKVVHLSRNFGHQIAVTAGIEAAKGDTVTIIDADLQDPPELILEFIKKWRQGYNVVYGLRKKREGESAFKKFTAALFYRLLSKTSKVNLPIDVGDFRLIDRNVTNAYMQFRERSRYFRGLIAWAGFKQIGIEYERKPRLHGETKYTLTKMFSFATDGITSFTSWPLKLAIYIGIVLSVISVGLIGYVIVGRIQGNNMPGWTSTVVLILGTSSVNFFCIGILGTYISKIFEEVQHRPLYFVQRKEGFKKLDT
jgi:dolichol-phosphate mannosyltransferase